MTPPKGDFLSVARAARSASCCSVREAQTAGLVCLLMTTASVRLSPMSAMVLLISTATEYPVRSIWLVNPIPRPSISSR